MRSRTFFCDRFEGIFVSLGEAFLGREYSYPRNQYCTGEKKGIFLFGCNTLRVPTYKQKRMSLEASQQRAGERTQTTAKKEEEEEDRVTSPTGPLSNVSSWANGDCADDLVESRATSVEAEEERGEDIVFEAERFERFYELRNEYNTHTIQRVYYEVFRVKTNVHNKEWMLLKILDTRRTTAEKAEERFLWLEELLKIERRSLAEEEAAAAEKINATTTTTTTTTTTPANNNSDDDDNDQGEEYRPNSKKQKNPMKSTGASADEDIFVSNPPQKTVAHNKIQRCTRNDGKKWNCKNIAEPGCKHCKLHLRWSSGARSKHNVNNLLLSVSAAPGVQKPPSSSSSLTAAVSLLNNETAGTHHHHYYHTATATATTTTTTTTTIALVFTANLLLFTDVALFVQHTCVFLSLDVLHCTDLRGEKIDSGFVF